MRKIFCGFSLAEVLITLVIIGIIAAITVPTMMNNKRNEELKTGLLKAQSTLSGALEMYFAKNGVRLLPENVKDVEFYNLIKPYIAVAKDCELHKCVGNNSTIYKTYNNKNNLHSGYLDEGQFIMNDSMLVLIQNFGSRLFISVDVNGYKKKPNKAGHDLFTFQLNSKGNLLPMGTKGTIYYSEADDFCSATSESDNNGFGCTVKALSDPNYFKNLH